MIASAKDTYGPYSFLTAKKQKALTDIWSNLSENYSDNIAMIDIYNDLTLTYKQLYKKIKYFAAGLQALGLKKGDHVSLFSENSSKWLIADQGILMAGGVDAVRGSQAPPEELIYIIQHSDSKALIVENLRNITTLNEYLDEQELNFVICLSDEVIPQEIKTKHNIYSFDQLIEIGNKTSFKKPVIKADDLATLVYTSGTTGRPKGVMITHANLLSQIRSIKKSLHHIKSGEKALSVLPTWHLYGRTCEYFMLSIGVTLDYTSPTNFKKDIQRSQPNYIVVVPRILDAIYNAIQAELRKQTPFKQKVINFLIKTSKNHIKSKRISKNQNIESHKNTFIDKVLANANYCSTYLPHKLANKLIFSKFKLAFGKNFKIAISGGGALTEHLEDFYEAIGAEIIVGYGLTETSPVLTIRNKSKNIKMAAGLPLEETKIKILDQENGKKLGLYKTGVVHVKGPQVMKGYYKEQKTTSEVLSSEGWLNTGDLGWLKADGNLVLTGRCKDLIVLSNGENVEPQPLEDACLTSPYINQIVLVGQDKPHLGALICPDEDFIMQWAEKQPVNYADTSDIYQCPKIHKILKKELKEHIKKRSNYRDFEKVKNFKLLNEPFCIENGLLTRTMKIKKTEVQKKYQNIIEDMYKN